MLEIKTLDVIKNNFFLEDIHIMEVEYDYCELLWIKMFKFHYYIIYIFVWDHVQKTSHTKGDTLLHILQKFHKTKQWCDFMSDKL